MCAQIVHAAGESAIPDLPPNTNAVVLDAVNETNLRQLAKKLQLAGIPHTVIQEVDPPFDGQVTAIGIVPLEDRSQIKKFVSSYGLLRASSSVVERPE